MWRTVIQTDGDKDPEAVTDSTSNVKQENSWEDFRWSNSPEYHRPPHVTSTPAYGTVTFNDDHSIELVKLMTFIANRSRPSTEDAKDILTQFDSNRYNHFVTPTEEDMAPPPPSTRDNTPTPKTVRLVDAPSEEDLVPPPPSTRDNTPLAQPTIVKTHKKGKAVDRPAPNTSTTQTDSKFNPSAAIPTPISVVNTSTIDDKLEEMRNRLHPSSVTTTNTKTTNTQPTKRTAPASTTSGPKTFAQATSMTNKLTPTPAAAQTLSPKQKQTKNKPATSGQSAKGLQYLVKFTPTIPKTWNDHNQCERIRERIKQKFVKQSSERKIKLEEFPRCLSVNYTTHNHVNIVFSPETTPEQVSNWAVAIVHATEAPGLRHLSPNKEWTKILVSHVPTHFMNVDTGEIAKQVLSNDVLDLVVRDHIPSTFFDKHPMPVKPRWFRHPNTLEKLGHRHDRIVLTVEDEDQSAVEELQKLGVAFGLRPSYINRFVEKPRMSLCTRCCSYECPNPRNCRRQACCALCGDKHTTQTHNVKCKLCIAEGCTNITDGKNCDHEAKCFSCKGNHEFGDHRCKSCKAYCRGIAEVLEEEKNRNSTPSPHQGSGDDDEAMSDISDNTEVIRPNTAACMITQQPTDTSAPGASRATAINVDEY